MRAVETGARGDLRGRTSRAGDIQVTCLNQNTGSFGHPMKIRREAFGVRRLAAAFRPCFSAKRLCLPLVALACSLGFTGNVPANDSHSLASPDGRIKVSVQWPAPHSTDNPRWSVSFRNQPILS